MDVKVDMEPRADADSKMLNGHGDASEDDDQYSVCPKVSRTSPRDTEMAGEGDTDTGAETKCSACFRRTEKVYDRLRSALVRHKPLLFRGVMIVFALLWVVYLIFAIIIRRDKAVPILILSICVLLVFGWKQFRRLVGDKIVRELKAHCVCEDRTKLWVKRCVLCLLVVGLLIFIVADTGRHVENITSLAGLVVFVLIVFITSTNPFKVKWRPVLWGLGLQFVMGLIILRWDKGYQAFSFLGEQVKTFLEYADAGSKFVFGPETYLLHPVAFKVLPVVVFFSAVNSALHYWGVIQCVVETLAWILQYTLNTTPIESLAGAAHIFVGQLESSLMLKPFLPKLTVSELHAVMTTGFATIAGTVVAAYIEFGAEAEHLLAASFMSGPAALALSKLSFPETEQSQTKSKKDVKLPRGQQRNVVEAASEGAANAVKLIAYIVVNIIAFLSILEFINAILTYLGNNVGIHNLSFQMICSYVFMPVAAVMGVPWEDTSKVGALIGTKVFINEFVGYAQLGPMIRSGEIQKRTGVIATYILCGFGSIQSLGIALGGYSAVAPSRRSDVAGHMVRALVLGNLACFTTACMAGMLYHDQVDVMGYSGNATYLLNSTMP
ncbi:sodium/nucleoside cotransporter 2-like [Liolophura sinensis]|uniref:sodium/nucleoside cotransporter 2-like n=1 Tax=Liolophura sinensis TaxID=3198878 RepID=UPI0031580320